MQEFTDDFLGMEAGAAGQGIRQERDERLSRQGAEEGSGCGVSMWGSRVIRAWPTTWTRWDGTQPACPGTLVTSGWFHLVVYEHDHSYILWVLVSRSRAHSGFGNTLLLGQLVGPPQVIDLLPPAPKDPASPRGMTHVELCLSLSDRKQTLVHIT